MINRIVVLFWYESVNMSSQRKKRRVYVFSMVQQMIKYIYNYNNIHMQYISNIYISTVRIYIYIYPVQLDLYKRLPHIFLTLCIQGKFLGHHHRCSFLAGWDVSTSTINGVNWATPINDLLNGSLFFCHPYNWSYFFGPYWNNWWLWAPHLVVLISTPFGGVLDDRLPNRFFTARVKVAHEAMMGVPGVGFQVNRLRR